jgi:hypothetical protein
VATVYSEVHVALREAVPEFGGVIDEHIAYHGRLLQHVLFGDLTRFVLAAQERDDQELVEPGRPGAARLTRGEPGSPPVPGMSLSPAPRDGSAAV